MSPPSKGPELSLVIPTFNERDNVAELVARIDQALTGVEWEVVFVDDDSADGTADVLRALSQQDRRVRVLQRIGRRGLASACVEGMLSCSAPYLGVMDADLQHDEAQLPRMLQVLREGAVDIVVGSRYVPGGSTGPWEASRLRMSRMAGWLTRALVPSTLHDPMSGFFMIRQDAFLARVRKLSGLGFKVMADLFASGAQPLRFAEIPYEFRNRKAGATKLDARVAWEFGLMLIDKAMGRRLPIAFVSFALVGAFGVIVHLVTLGALRGSVLESFAPAQAVATATAMVFNFFLNNQLTYSDRRLRGWQLIPGLLSFVLICSVGAVANVALGAYLFERGLHWVLAALSGIIAGAVWNFGVSRTYTWGQPR